MGKKTKVQVGEEFCIAINLAIKNFRHNEKLKEYEFPSSLTSKERCYIHQYCQQLGMKSKSRGDGANRYLTIYKKEGSTIVQADALFQIGQMSKKHILNLLQRYPITAREKQELILPTERDRMGHEVIRDISRSIGRLGSSMPMIPHRKCENEFTPFRQTLPIWNCQEEILQIISCHQVVLISGETGSGKTTQVPQFILDHCSVMGQPCRIICSQPRRIAAISVAERVAFERDEKIGQTIGYQVRLESRISPKTLVTFCTNGVLLRTLMGGDATMATVSHILVDELHERDRFCDFLLIVLRDLLLKFRNLKLVLMSASLDTQLFSKYFSNCPVIEVPGRVYDVKTYFLEDILRGTGYTNKTMKKLQSSAGKKQSKSKVDSWCSLQPADKNDEICTENASPIFEKDFGQEIKIQDLSLNDPDVYKEEDLDPEVASKVDKIIEDVWLSAESDFSELRRMILSENVSVDYQHSETNVSPLMLASGKGNTDFVEQLLILGASIHIKSSNGWTAIDWANHFNHKEIADLLTAQWNIDTATQIATDAYNSQLEIAEEDKVLLDIYQSSVDDEKVDHDLIIYLLERICASQEEGAVLVFLPGYDDIVVLRDRISNELESVLQHKAMVFTLHSQMQSSDQKRVFRPSAPGIRKIVLATNIAETSITINDVVFVVDSGKVKERSYDAITGVTMLRAGWISKASALQRKGRAGRCRPGLCYHLYSRVRFDSFRKFQVPEILRVPIHELCLQAKLLAPPNAPIADFLAKAADPPPFMVTRNALNLLKTIDALDQWEELTELGLHLLDLPIDPRHGKMILYSVLLKCLDPVLTIVCCLSYRDPFLLPSQPSQKRAVALVKRKLAGETNSDHMVLLQAFQEWQRAKNEGRERAFCAQNFISHATMEMIVGMRSQLLGQLRASGFIRGRGNVDIRDLNSNSDVWPVIKAALCAGTYPHLIRIDRERKQLVTQKESKVRFHHASVLNKLPLSSKETADKLRKQKIKELQSDWLFYEEMMRCGSFAHAVNCTIVSPITVALFAGPARLPPNALHEHDTDGSLDEEDSEDEYDFKCDNQNSQKAMLKLDDWVSFRIEPEIAKLLFQLRQKWQALFLRRVRNPSKMLTQADETVIHTVVNVLTAEDISLNLHQPMGVGLRSKLSAGTSNELETAIDITPSNNFNSVYKNSNFRSFPKQTYNHTSQIIPGLEYKNSDRSHSQIRYFIIKANTSRVMEISMAHNIWAFSQATERKLMSAVKEGKEIILIFSIQGSGHFQGFAHFTLRLSDKRFPEFSTAHHGTCYQIEWIKKANIPFQSTRHLQNSWNENRKVQISRDGQELEPMVGEQLCKLITKCATMGTDHFKAARKSDAFYGEHYSNDTSRDSIQINRSLVYWNQNHASPSSWYDSSTGSNQRQWSQK